MKQAIELTAFNSNIDQLNTKFEQDRQTLKAQGDELEATKRTLNRSNQKAVDEFNARINEFNAAQKSFNASIAAQDAKNRDGRTSSHAFNTACAGVSYSKADEAVVLADLGLTENPMRMSGQARLQSTSSCKLDQQTVFERAEKAYSARDYVTALREYLALDRCGDARAQRRIGDMHYAGLGVPQNLGEARDWYLKAAKQGHETAQFNLGVIYFGGMGVTQDYAEARKWYSKAAQQGHANAQNALGAMLNGGQGGPRNSGEAASWFLKSAEQGYAPAQNNLGIAFASGKGMPQNFAEAAKWYKRAAEQRLAQAQFHLAGLYRRGEGVPLDVEEAYRWYMKAAEQGDAEAQYNLGMVYHQGTGVTADPVEAVNWLFRAARQGHVIAQFKMAVTYMKLSLREKPDRTDLVKAQMWATLAERTACAQVGASQRNAATTSAPYQNAYRTACSGARQIRAAAALKMNPAETAQAEKLVREWKANSGDDAPPSSAALREPPAPGTLQERLRPLPPRPPAPASGASTGDVFTIGPPPKPAGN
ncbi:hypothetical protein RPMA_23905 [Tardiphaga alba]|uniref:TPR repeat protein n=1 Tax=Tardiphaga alba TaxID=340268 RepID=A0ABX8ACQ6_9BRAD|nr:SEL1-like repeat protein [Tardiphaga alba]QUS41551.1 hypothetical protein RPMA_23905 [Tardiphaga alba]